MQYLLWRKNIFLANYLFFRKKCKHRQRWSLVSKYWLILMSQRVAPRDPSRDQHVAKTWPTTWPITWPITWPSTWPCITWPATWPITWSQPRDPSRDQPLDPITWPTLAWPLVRDGGPSLPLSLWPSPSSATEAVECLCPSVVFSSSQLLIQYLSWRVNCPPDPCTQSYRCHGTSRTLKQLDQTQHSTTDWTVLVGKRNYL